MLRLLATLLLAATYLLHTEGRLTVSTENVLTCGEPDNVHRLSCAKGVISVWKALYGRADSKTCATGQPPKKLSNKACSQEGTLKKLQNRCDGKKVCNVKISSIQAPDSCPGTYKYLQTTHHCLPAFHEEACEKRNARLQCDFDETVVLYNANYGRTDPTKCNPRGREFNVKNCRAPGAFREVDSRCKGKSICRIPAKNSVFGDPCPHIKKYLEADYTCERAVYQCQDRRIRLSCFGGPVLSIVSATYGRTDKEKCGYGYSESSLKNTTCSIDAPIISTMCDGKPNCNIQVNGSVLGNPCPDTHKYLDVVYQCVPKP